jgi:hypothetical protein
MVSTLTEGHSARFGPGGFRPTRAYDCSTARAPLEKRGPTYGLRGVYETPRRPKTSEPRTEERPAT